MRCGGASSPGDRRSHATADATLLCARRVPCVEAGTTVDQTEGASDRVRLRHADVLIRETKKDGGVRLTCDYCYLITFTVGDVSLIPTIDEGLRDIVRRQVM